MLGSSGEIVFVGICLIIIAAAMLALLAWLMVFRPRLGLYVMLALAPTQFLFIPIRDFFISPADLLGLAAAAGVLLRIALGNRRTRAAIRLHVMVGLMVVAYLVGFVVLDYSTRTLLRLPLAVVPSILACELLETRRHFVLAACALIAAGILDASYGLIAVGIGSPLHPTRFSGMMSVNFSAIAILTAAAVGGCLLSRTVSLGKQLAVVSLAFLGLATLSRGGVLAFLAAVALIIWPLATSMNRRRMVILGVTILALVLVDGEVRDRMMAREAADVQRDGIARRSTDVRTLILRSAWDGLGTRPFVGLGFFNFENYSVTNTEIRQSTSGLGYGTHNTYIEVLVEGGIFAFASFALHFLVPLLRALPLIWVGVLQRKDVVLGAAMAGLIVALVSAAAANVLLHFLFWGITGVGLSFASHLASGRHHTWLHAREPGEGRRSEYLQPPSDRNS